MFPPKGKTWFMQSINLGNLFFYNNKKFTGLSPSLASFSITLQFSIYKIKFGLVRFRSPLLTESRLIFVPLAT